VPPGLTQPLSISASIDCGDYLAIGETVAALASAGIDLLHVDVMDGHFVPNLGVGLNLLDALGSTGSRLDVHLMVADPFRWLDELEAARVEIATVHFESTNRPFQLLERIRSLRMSAGLALNPATPLDPLIDLLPWCDQVVVMGVDPGRIGQTFIPGTVRRVDAVAELIRTLGTETVIEVDGAVDFDNLETLWNAGARRIVAGARLLFPPGADVVHRAQLLTEACRRLHAFPVGA
jgi:ribulose-phosphate 3-epimerase